MSGAYGRVFVDSKAPRCWSDTGAGCWRMCKKPLSGSGDAPVFLWELELLIYVCTKQSELRPKDSAVGE